MDRLFDILKRAKERFPAFTQRLEEARAMGQWAEAVGPGIAKHSKALWVRDGVLFVEVDHPIWKSELSLRKLEILKKLPFQDLCFLDPGQARMSLSRLERFEKNKEKNQDPKKK